MYGNDDADESYNQALALIDAHPDLKLIMAPTTVGIAAAAKAMQDEGLCETVKVSGLGLPDEMQCVHRERLRPAVRAVELRRPRLPRPSTPPTASATGALKAEEGATFTAGRMGEYTIEKDPTRDAGPAHRHGSLHRLRRDQRRRLSATRRRWWRGLAGTRPSPTGRGRPR